MWNGINCLSTRSGRLCDTQQVRPPLCSCKPSSALPRGLHHLPGKPSQTSWESFRKGLMKNSLSLRHVPELHWEEKGRKMQLKAKMVLSIYPVCFYGLQWMLQIAQSSRNPSPWVTQVLRTARCSIQSWQTWLLDIPNCDLRTFDSPCGVTWWKLLQGMATRGRFKRVRKVTKAYVG